MKRYLTGILAIIIAVGATAFTRPAKNLSMVTFKYTPPTLNDYSQASVQEKSNWDLGTQPCPDGEDKACTLQVPSEETAPGGTELGTSVTITADEGSETGKFYVSGGTFVSNIINKD